GLLSWVVEFIFVRSPHDEFRRWRIPDRGVLPRPPVPRRVFLSDVPAWLVLEPIVGPGENRAPLVPDDLLMMDKFNPQQAIQNLAGELRGVPDVGYFQAGDQRKCVGPVGPRVRRYR